MIAIYIYVACTLIVAVRLAFHMRWRLDRFDWHNGDVWSNFWITLLLWPLALIKPRIIISPVLTSRFLGIDLAARARELDRLRNNLPPCGLQIRFVSNQEEGSTHNFTFDRSTVHQALASGIAECVPHLFGQRHDIFRWINNNSPSTEVITDAPSAWWEFMYVASALLRNGNGTVLCGNCGKEMPADGLRVETIGLREHMFDAWYCTCGCRLLLVY